MSWQEREVLPHVSRWEEQGVVDCALFEKAGEAGLLGIRMREEANGEC